MQANIDVLTAMNVADLQKSFKVDQRPVLRRIVAVLGWWPARRLARSMAGFCPFLCDAYITPACLGSG